MCGVMGWLCVGGNRLAGIRLPAGLAQACWKALCSQEQEQEQEQDQEPEQEQEHGQEQAGLPQSCAALFRGQQEQEQEQEHFSSS